jgi:hypothetical protein
MAHGLHKIRRAKLRMQELNVDVDAEESTAGRSGQPTGADEW